jgi:hypothetical protein
MKTEFSGLIIKIPNFKIYFNSDMNRLGHGFRALSLNVAKSGAKPWHSRRHDLVMLPDSARDIDSVNPEFWKK